MDSKESKHYLRFDYNRVPIIDNEWSDGVKGRNILCPDLPRAYCRISEFDWEKQAQESMKRMLLINISDFTDIFSTGSKGNWLADIEDYSIFYADTFKVFCFYTSDGDP